MRLNAHDARPYFEHASQRQCDLDPSALHDNGIEYRAEGGICLAFHATFWPTVWMVHIGVMPSAWGELDRACIRLLTAFQAEKQAKRIIAWIPENNRAVAALARRVGFVTDGTLPLPQQKITMIGWGA